MYLDNYDDTFPMSAFHTGTCVATFYWALNPLLKSQEVNRCPSEPDATSVVNMFVAFGGACPSTPPFTSYSTNKDLFIDGFAGLDPLTMGDVQDAAGTIMQYDGNVAADSSQPVQARHSGNFDASFADGHVKSIKATTSGQTAPPFPGSGYEGDLTLYTIGSQGGFYAGKTEAKGVPGYVPPGP
jgi:prepilin-type processing-associated H-X9-DG protein